jgi:F-type H+-transporting ATPase subunit b
MLIDWFTVIAQIVNFLVLVGLMKHFLYGPLVNAIDAREQRIAKRLAEAAQKNQDAEQRVAAAKAEIDDVEKQREQMIAAARQEGEREHKEMLQKSRDSIRELETKWHADLEREKSAFLDEVRSRAANEVLTITRRALIDLASADLQDSAVRCFLEKLETVDGTTVGEEIVLRTQRDVEPELRRKMDEIVARRFGEGVRVKYERSPQMSWGVELRTNGRRIGWNPETYIGSLEEHLRQALEHTS